MRNPLRFPFINAIVLLGGAGLISACSQPPTQITINANSSADKTNTYTETNSIQIEENNSIQTEANLTATAASKNSTVVAPPVDVAPIAAPPATAEFGTCTWNGQPEQCSAKWVGKTATVTWLSDSKETRYDFDAGTVFDTVNSKTYKAISSDYSSGCISTANGATCIYR